MPFSKNWDVIKGKPQPLPTTMSLYRVHTLNELLSRPEGPFSDFAVTHKGFDFEVYTDLDGDVWGSLPNKDAIEAFWDWIGAPTQPEFTVFLDYKSGDMSYTSLPHRLFNEANEDRS